MARFTTSLTAVPSEDTPGTVVLTDDQGDVIAVNTDAARSLARQLIRAADERDAWDVNRTAGAEFWPQSFADGLASDLGFRQDAGRWVRP